MPICQLLADAPNRTSSVATVFIHNPVTFVTFARKHR